MGNTKSPGQGANSAATRSAMTTSLPLLPLAVLAQDRPSSLPAETQRFTSDEEAAVLRGQRDPDGPFPSRPRAAG